MGGPSDSQASEVDEERARRALGIAVRRALARVERRAAAIKSDLAKADAAHEEAERAQLFVAAAAKKPRGTRRLTAVDWSTGAARPIQLVLDPSRDPSEQVGAVFKRARRLAKGRALASERLRATEAIAEKLRSLAQAVPTSLASTAELEDTARQIARQDFNHVLKIGPARSEARQIREKLPPYRKFAAAGGAFILVGRNASRNDELTLHVARPRDLWLHARGWAGAHVVVPLPRDASCPSKVLVQAAHLAAHFSDARSEAVVEVTYTPRRFVRKTRGSPAGAVVIDREKVLVLRKEPGLLRQLLDAEVEP